MSAKQFASQGADPYRRPLAEAGLPGSLFHDTGRGPFSSWTTCSPELDARRQAFVLGHINGGSFLSPAVRTKLEGLGREKVFRIHAGRLV